MGVKVIYYIAPQAWAWKSYRVKVLNSCVDLFHAGLVLKSRVQSIQLGVHT